MLNSAKDLEILIQTVEDSERIGYLYEEEINGFSFIWGDVYFPCFAVINGTDSMVYSVDDVRELRDNANSMLELI